MNEYLHNFSSITWMEITLLATVVTEESMCILDSFLFRNS